MAEKFLSLSSFDKIETNTFQEKASFLKYTTQVIVRFNEADPLGIVWHGHYIRYMEDGREDFGRHFGISYLDFYNNGLVVPIVSVNCDYKNPLRYGDTIDVEVIYHSTKSAKLVFEYVIKDSKSQKVVATGSSTQVFVNKDNFELYLTIPPFFEEWKNKMNLN